MSKKSNAHPDYYKPAGRDRQDDAAAARQARATAAKPSSQQRPGRMSNGSYFQRPEPAPTASPKRRAGPAEKKPSTRPARPKASKVKPSPPHAARGRKKPLGGTKRESRPPGK